MRWFRMPRPAIFFTKAIAILRKKKEQSGSAPGPLIGVLLRLVRLVSHLLSGLLQHFVQFLLGGLRGSWANQAGLSGLTAATSTRTKL